MILEREPMQSVDREIANVDDAALAVFGVLPAHERHRGAVGRHRRAEVPGGPSFRVGEPLRRAGIHGDRPESRRLAVLRPRHHQRFPVAGPGRRRQWLRIHFRGGEFDRLARLAACRRNNHDPPGILLHSQKRQLAAVGAPDRSDVAPLAEGQLPRGAARQRPHEYVEDLVLRQPAGAVRRLFAVGRERRPGVLPGFTGKWHAPRLPRRSVRQTPHNAHQQAHQAES